MRFPFGKESFIDWGVYEFFGFSQVAMLLSQVSLNLDVKSNNLRTMSGWLQTYFFSKKTECRLYTCVPGHPVQYLNLQPALVKLSHHGYSLWIERYRKIGLLYALCSHLNLDHIQHEAKTWTFEYTTKQRISIKSYVSNINVYWLILNHKLA